MLEMIIQYFSGFYGQLELAATVLLIANVYLLAKEKLINYWFGLAGVLIFGYIFYGFNLYSDALLQWAFYAPLQIVGYYMWKYGRTLGETASDAVDSMKIVTLSTSMRIFWVALILAMAAALGYVMSGTDASYPYLDALTTSMSIIASILLLKKVLENWIVWIVMDLIAIPLYYSKELYVTSGLYVIFLGLATYGLITWMQKRKTYEEMQNA